MTKLIVDNSIITDEDVINFKRYLTELVELNIRADIIEEALLKNEHLPSGAKHKWIFILVRNEVQFNVLAKTTQFVNFIKFADNYHLRFTHNNYHINAVLTPDEFENWVQFENCDGGNK